MNKRDFINENKKVLIIGGLITALAIGLVVFYVMNNANNSEQSSQDSYESSYVDPLPEFSQVTQPMMYDYIQGTLGYHAEVPFEFTPGYYYAIAVNTNELSGDEGFIYVSTYGPNNVLPTIGSDYVGLKLSGDQWDKVKNCIATWPEELSATEGEYKVCALTTSSNAGLGDKYFDYYLTEGSSAADWCSINFKGFRYEDSKFLKNYALSNGLPTDWIRQFNDRYNGGVQNIETPLHTDFANPFYDKYNYHQIITLKNPDGEKEEFYVTGINRFNHVSERDENGHVVLDEIIVSQDIINAMMNDLGYSIV